MDAPPPLIVGNWKMHGLSPALAQAREVAQALVAAPSTARVGLCVPATLLERVNRALAGSPVMSGGETCHAEACGAFTGDVSAEMLADAGARLVIVGHSERRSAYGETDAQVEAKARAGLRAQLLPIICVGETARERAEGRTLEVVCGQLRGSTPADVEGGAVAIAYEPIWAIGAGRAPEPDEIAHVHAALRDALVDRLGETGRGTPILYGGSVTPEIAASVLATPEVGGALVGGASLEARDFLAIVRCAAA